MQKIIHRRPSPPVKQNTRMEAVVSPAKRALLAKVFPKMVGVRATIKMDKNRKEGI